MQAAWIALFFGGLSVMISGDSGNRDFSNRYAE
jgi:hypothetical protein